MSPGLLTPVWCSFHPTLRVWRIRGVGWQRKGQELLPQTVILRRPEKALILPPHSLHDSHVAARRPPTEM